MTNSDHDSTLVADFDPDPGSLTPVADYPLAVTDIAGQILLGGEMVVLCGGRDGSGEPTDRCFHMVKKENGTMFGDWRPFPSMPQPRYGKGFLMGILYFVYSPICVT